MRDEWTDAMLDGAFERAWAVCDRILAERKGRRCAGLPHHLRWVWDGAPLAGKRVLVRCYHGLGDTLQFIRFVPRLAAIGSMVIVEAQAALHPLLRRVPGIDALCRLDATLPAWDVAIESMELPHALRITLADLPGTVPYLAPPEILPQPADPRGARAPRPRVGLVWGAGDWRRERSLPPALLLPLTRMPLDLVGLQIGSAREEAAAAGLLGALHTPIPERSTIAETAALICSLDLVVTVDTMVAHLAGALGRPVWTLLDAEADWRWMRQRSDSPWYPTMRLFRQPEPGKWEPVMAQLAAALTSVQRRRGTRPATCLLRG